MHHLMILLLYLAIGLAVGVMSGFIGLSAGFFCVPILFWVFHFQGIPYDDVMQLAIGTALAIVVLTATNASITHQLKGSINWVIFIRFFPAVSLGALSASVIRSYLTSGFLHVLYILYLLAILGYSLYKKTFTEVKASSHPKVPSHLFSFFYGASAGLLAITLGMSGSSMNVPLFRRLKLPMVQAMGTATSLTLPAALIGLIGHLMVKHTASPLPDFTTGYVYWPAVVGVGIGGLLAVPLGVRLTYKVVDFVMARVYLAALALASVVMAL